MPPPQNYFNMANRSRFGFLPSSRPKRSNFDLSHDVKMSFQLGRLTPFLVMDAVPGDTFKISSESLFRFAPLIAPVMHTVDLKMEYFFVPNRILWPDFPKWIVGDSSLPPGLTPPVCAYEGEEDFIKSIGNYLGYTKPQTGSSYFASAFPIAAYCKIFDEYYRDQNLVPEEFVEPLKAGADNSWCSAAMAALPFRRAWEHDYFTSALPFAQKGDDVLIPVNGNVEFQSGPPGTKALMRDPVTGAPIETGVTNIQRLDADGFPIIDDSGVVSDLAYDPQGTLVSTPDDESTINTLRRAYALQSWLERNARYGTRYIEQMLAHFGVISSDSRLQRPELIGTSRGRMSISEVLATAQSEDVPVGQMSGHGIGVNKSTQIKYSCEEHGWIIGIVTAMPRTAYQQGLHKMFNRNDRFDYLWPDFANIGEQAIKNSEIFVTSNNAQNEGTFGYVPRYSEYRYVPSRVAGEFQTTLNYWHWGRIFASLPVLNQSFVECNPSTRPFAVIDESVDHIYCHIMNGVSAQRPLPKYGVPK